MRTIGYHIQDTPCVIFHQLSLDPGRYDATLLLDLVESLRKRSKILDSIITDFECQNGMHNKSSNSEKLTEGRRPSS